MVEGAYHPGRHEVRGICEDASDGSTVGSRTALPFCCGAEGCAGEDGPLWRRPAVHAGDSRAYLLHNGNIMQITTDHSMVQELIKNGDLTVEQAKVHPQKNIITRALGVNPVVEIDYEKVPLAKDDRILICTDGLTNYIEPEKIRNLADDMDSVSLADRLVALAKENGGGDNITVAILDN